MDKHSGLLIALGLGPKSAASSPPPSSILDQMTKGRSGGNLTSAPTLEDQQNQQNQGGKVSRDEAGFVSDDNVCGGCANFTKETGECSKVEGMMEPCDKCIKFYEPANKAGDMDDDASGGDDLSSILGSSGSQPSTPPSGGMGR